MKTREFNPKWVEDAKNGDQEAITHLYHYSYQAVYLTIKSMLRSEEDTVLDLVQDVFLKAFERLEQLENADRFQAWIKQIARNKVLDYQKKSKAVLFSELAAEDGEGDVFEFEAEDTSSYHLPDLALDKQETVRLIREILDSLPEGQRIVVGLYYYQDLSIKEIAELLERSEGTVKSQLHYGRKTIEKKVNELEQRDNIKLHSMAPLPFLLYLLRRAENMPVEPNEAILQNILRSNAGTTPTAAAGKAAPSQTVAGAVSKAAGTAGKGIALKITGAVLAVALIGGGTAAIINRSQMQSDGKPTDSSADVTLETESEARMEFQQEENYDPSDDTDQILDTPEITPEDYQAAMNAYADKLYELLNDCSGDTQPHFQLVYLDGDDLPELAVADASFGKGTQQVFYQWNSDTGAAEKLGSCGCYGYCYYWEREGCTYAVISGDSLVSNEYYSLQGGTLQLVLSRSFYVSLDTGAEENNTYTVEGRETTESDFLTKLAELTGETTEENAVSKFTLLTYDDGYEITTENIKAVLGV